MTGPHRTLRLSLLAVCVLFLIFLCKAKVEETLGISGMLYANGTPVGGDFINLWSAAQLVLSGHSAQIYDSTAFMAFERGLVGGNIGLRLWAYPPHSLLAAWPFGLIGFYPALAAWSLLGLGVLWFGARRFGFERLEAVIILLSPASVLSVYYGQTGNLAAGLLLFALSARGPGAVIAASLLTFKPQTGFLLPVLWLFQRCWWAIAGTVALTIALIAVASLLFGIGAWRDYLGDTLPLLGQLERSGTGPFMYMVPSAFMALRLLTGNGDLALLLHLGFAVAVGIVLLVRLWQVDDPVRRAALVMIATALMTPYLHNYDLVVLLCGALLVARRWPLSDLRSLLVGIVVAVALILPSAVVTLNALGVPISPLLILPLLFLA